MHVVFLRGVNVGGKRFKPANLAKELASLEVTSVAAAGTFVVGGKVSAEKTRAAFAEALPFEADIYVRPAQEILALKPPASPPDAKVFLTVLASKPKAAPKLPVDWPEEGPWQLRLAEFRHPYALALRRAAGGEFYPNEILEKALGVRATTRGWSTIEAVRKLLQAAA